MGKSKHNAIRSWTRAWTAILTLKENTPSKKRKRELQVVLQVSKYFVNNYLTIKNVEERKN